MNIGNRILWTKSKAGTSVFQIESIGVISFIPVTNPFHSLKI